MLILDKYMGDSAIHIDDIGIWSMLAANAYANIASRFHDDATGTRAATGHTVWGVPVLSFSNNRRWISFSSIFRRKTCD